MAMYDLTDEQVFLIRTLGKHVLVGEPPNLALDADKVDVLASIIEDDGERQQFKDTLGSLTRSNTTITLPAPPSELLMP